MIKNKSFLYSLVILFCINAGLLFMIHFNWNNSMKLFFPMQKELFSIRNNITEAHLWFEKMISDDTIIDVHHDIIIPFEHKNFKKYLNQIISNEVYEENSSLLEYLHDIDTHLDDLYTLALYRLVNLDLNGIGRVNDYFFDEEYNLSLLAIDTAILHINSNLETEIINKNSYFKYVFFFFIITNIIIFIMMFIIRNRNEKQDKMIFEQTKMVSMGEMIGNIAHQWRQPLSVISTGVTGMQVQKKYDTLDDETFDKTCNIINQNAQYLSNTIDDFRDYIKGDSQKVKFNLDDEIKSFLSLVDTTIKHSNIKVIIEIEDDINIYGYKNELTQCLINLFHNSKDAFIERNDIENRYIFINGLVNQNTLELKIKDNAGGIPANILKKIYEPYFTTKHKSQGTGLGLHMTYNLIHNTMNGEIQTSTSEYFYNDKKCIGAEFIMQIPIQ